MSVDDSNIKSLLHFDGINNGVSFVDESAKIWTAAGNAITSTTQKKFGLAAGYFDGNGDYITTPDHADFVIGSGDFTVDLWIFPSANAFVGFCSQSTNGNTASVTSFYFGRDYSTSKLRGTISNGTSLFNVLSTTLLSNILNVWTHVALERYGTSLNIYVNGVKEGTTNIGAITVPDVASALRIGYLDPTLGAYYAGYIDEFRFSNIARYQGANFTVPTGPYAGGGVHNATRGRNRFCGNVDPRIPGYTISY